MSLPFKLFKTILQVPMMFWKLKHVLKFYFRLENKYFIFIEISSNQEKHLGFQDMKN